MVIIDILQQDSYDNVILFGRIIKAFREGIKIIVVTNLVLDQAQVKKIIELGFIDVFLNKSQINPAILLREVIKFLRIKTPSIQQVQYELHYKDYNAGLHKIGPYRTLTELRYRCFKSFNAKGNCLQGIKITGANYYLTSQECDDIVKEEGEKIK